MWFDSSLAGLSTGITFCVQVACVYLATLCICTFIQNPRARVRIWGYFLLITNASWLLLWIPVRTVAPVRFAFRSTLPPPPVSLHLALPVTSAWASGLSAFLPAAGRIYLVLLLFSFLHLLLQSMRLRSVLRRTQPPAPQLQLLFQELCLELGIRRSQLGLVSQLRSPATCYWLRSHVLLPAELVPRLDREQLADVLRHELTHVRQRDYLWDRLAALGCRLVFFHPLVWLAYRNLRRERELACDHAVVARRGEARLPYAECLTRLARWFVEERSVSEGIGFSSSESLLALRVRALLREPSSYSPFQRAARLVLVEITATATLFLVPSLGFSLYSSFPLTALLGQPRTHMDFAARRTNPAKAQRSSPKIVASASLWKLPHSESLGQVSLFLSSPSAPLPVLQGSSPENNGPAEDSTPSGEIGDSAQVHTLRPAWDEAPMALASPPKWRRLALRAITGGVALATGKDADDDDGPHKRIR